MTDRLTADTINSDALDALYDEIDRLRAGEEDGYDPLAVPTPGQWIHQFNQATAEKRLEVVGRMIDAAERVWACTMNRHEERIHDGRHAEMALNEVRQVVADMAAQGALQWAGWLRDAMKRGPKHCLLCATEAPSGPAGTEGTEEHNLAHALGGDRTAKTIAHTLTVHGHTLDAVRTMTYAELLAVPGIGGPSLARIRESLDGWPEPDGTDEAEAEAEADPDGKRAQYAALAFNAVLPALKAHDRWLPLSARRAVADAVLAVRDEQLEQLADRHHRLGIELKHWQTVITQELRTERDQLAAALREVLDAFTTARRDDGVIAGHLIEGAIHPDDMNRWRAVLEPTKEQP